MQSTDGPIALKARYVFPVDSAPLSGGVITILGERIVAVGENTSGREPRDLGNVAILPGLINAHTHLEFSDLPSPLGQPGMGFAQWVRTVVEHRRQSGGGDQAAAAHRQLAVRDGLSEVRRSGTTLLGEIATPGWPDQPFRDATVDCVIFLELLGLSPDRTDALVDMARRHVQLGTSPDVGWRAGVSPHAPYTAHPELIARAAELSSKEHVPIAMHVAESPEELELLRYGSGALLDLLVDLEAWDPTAIPPGTAAVDYLRLLSKAHRALVIHGNYLDEEAIDLLSRHADRMSVVFCPRTYAYFQHADYPLGKLITAGVNVALGTDSRASNPDLRLLEDMRSVARRYGDVPPERVLRLGTIGGAEALGQGHEVGSLRAGKRADLTIVRLPDSDASDPHDLVLGYDLPVELAYYRGRPTK